MWSRDGDPGGDLYFQHQVKPGASAQMNTYLGHTFFWGRPGSNDGAIPEFGEVLNDDYAPLLESVTTIVPTVHEYTYPTTGDHASL